MGHFDNHSHSWFSNLRLLDCINKPKDLIDQAIKLGLSGIAITDHETVSSWIEVNKYAKELQETNPDFRIALGNEIYLTETRDMGQKYYHFILIAKDAIGAKGIREMSSIAWMNSYFDRGLERVPLLKSELYDIMERYRGHIIGTTACIGGELGVAIMNLDKCEQLKDDANAKRYHEQIVQFLEFGKMVFGDDFYLEVAPGESEEQVLVNKRIKRISEAFEIPMCIGSDAHYLSKEDRYVHKAYLNSKGGEREVDAFYEFTYVQSDDEVRQHLRPALSDDDIDRIFENSIKMKDSIEFYSLERPQMVPEVEVKDYPKTTSWLGVNNWKADELVTLRSLMMSDNIQERYWVNECLLAMQDKGLLNDDRYWLRLEEEARVKRVIGEKLGTCMFAYPNTLKHYVDLFWECGSTVGAGRGSACAALNHYLLGITQLDPIEWDLPFWRYLNDERTELGDIDLDLAPSKIQKIFREIRKERGELGLVQVCTFGTEGTKSAVLTACRGYRSDEYPNGIDVDEAQYLSSLIPSERGFLWPIDDVVNGNAEKGRKPVASFISTVNQYPGLLDIITHIQGIVNKRSSHASGVILFDSDIYETAAVMRTPKGALITQWDLHDQEAAGGVKYDFLLTSVQDIIIQTIELLQEDG